MRDANRLLIFIFGLAALAACQKNQPDQKVAIDNGMIANADIEALPPDESSATPSNELVNGADNPDVNSVGNNSD